MIPPNISCGCDNVAEDGDTSDSPFEAERNAADAGDAKNRASAVVSVPKKGKKKQLSSIAKARAMRKVKQAGNSKDAAAALTALESKEPQKVLFYHSFGGCRPGVPAEDLASLILASNYNFESKPIALRIEEYHVILTGLQPILSRHYPLRSFMNDFNVSCLLQWVRHVLIFFRDNSNHKKTFANPGAMSEVARRKFNMNAIILMREVRAPSILKNALDYVRRDIKNKCSDK